MLYELTFLAKTEDVAGIKKILGDNGCEIASEKAPVKMRLAYPIKKEGYCFIGAFVFKGNAETTNKAVMSALSLEENILRSMIHRVEEKSSLKVKERSERPQFVQKKVEKKVEPTLTNEALKEKIEEILK